MDRNKIRGLGESSEGSSKEKLTYSLTRDGRKRREDKKGGVERTSKSLPHEHALDVVTVDFKLADKAKTSPSWDALDKDFDETLQMMKSRTGIKKGEISDSEGKPKSSSKRDILRAMVVEGGETDDAESSHHGDSSNKRLDEAPEFPRLRIKRREVDVARGIAASAWEQLGKRFGWIGEHRPERVNKVIDAIDSDLGKIHEVLNAPGLASDLKESMYGKVNLLKRSIDDSYKNALHGYGDGSGERAIRDEGEQRIKDLQHEMGKVREDLEKLHQVYKNVEAIETYVPQAFRPFVRQSAQEVSDRVLTACREGINNYRPGEGWSISERGQLDHDSKWLEARGEELKEVCERHADQIERALDEQWVSFRDFSAFAFKWEESTGPTDPMKRFRERYSKALSQYWDVLHEYKTGVRFTPDAWQEELEKHLDICNKLNVEKMQILRENIKNLNKDESLQKYKSEIKEMYKSSSYLSIDESWKKRYRLHEIALTILKSRGEEALHDGVNEYQDSINNLRTEFEDSFRNGKFDKARECIQRFASEVETLKTRLGEHGLLETIPHLDKIHLGEILDHLKKNVSCEAEPMEEEMRECKATLADLISDLKFVKRDKIMNFSKEEKRSLNSNLESLINDFEKIYNDPGNWVQQGEGANNDSLSKLYEIHYALQRKNDFLDERLCKKANELYSKINHDMKYIQEKAEKGLFLPSIKNEFLNDVSNDYDEVNNKYKKITEDYQNSFTVAKESVTNFLKSIRGFQRKKESLDQIIITDIDELYKTSHDTIISIQEKLDKGYVSKVMKSEDAIEKLKKRFEENINPLISKLEDQRSRIVENFKKTSIVDQSDIEEYHKFYNKLQDINESLDR